MLAAVMDGRALVGRRAVRGVSLLVALLLVGCAAAALAPGAGAYIYWARGAGGGIGRANNDGSNVQQKFIRGPGVGKDCGVAVDDAHIYWLSAFNGTTEGVGRANLDGTGVNQSFIPTPRNDPCGPAVDAGHVYWGNRFNKTIGRADINGANPDQSFIKGQFLPCSVAVDGNHIYWTPGIMESNLDGSNVQPLVPGATGCGVAVDSDHIYWVNPSDTHQSGSIGRANLDGTNVDQTYVRFAVGNACGIAVDSRYIYWMDQNFGTIRRAPISGDRHDVGTDFIKTDAARQACGVAVDQAGPGAGRLDLGKTSLNRSRGTAKLKATVDGSGELKLRAKGHGIKRVSHRVRGADKVTLKVEARGRKERLLRRRGRVKVEALVKFKSSNGASSTRHRQIKLVRR
jgi:hypothetical protein